MRIFINNRPWSLSTELHAYTAQADKIRYACVVVTKEEIKLFKCNVGLWNIATFKLKEMLRPIEEDMDEYQYFGCLGEKNKYMYKFTFVYYKNYFTPQEISLPDKKVLKRMGLV